MEREALQAGLVWILDVEGSPWGAGVLIGRGRVLTCAHVVVAALRWNGRQGAPSDPVQVQFTHLGRTAPILARVDPQNWFEPGPSGPEDPGAGDIAVLVLEGDAPTGAVPVEGWVVGPDHGVEIVAFGLPAKHDAGGGGFAGGHLVGTQPSGWVQIDGKEGGYRIQPGFSGAPAWSDEVSGIVGVIVAAELDQEARVGWMIPTSQVASRVAEIGAPATAPDISDASRYTAPVDTDERDAGYFRVSQIVDAPAGMPTESSDPEELAEWMLANLQQWFDAKIIVNVGTDDGIEKGDYFDQVAKHEPIVVDGKRAGFLDQPGNLLCVVEPKPTYSICRLSEFSYTTFFNVLLPRRMDQVGGGDDDAEIDTADLAALFSVVVAGDLVARIESKERDARDAVEELYSETLDDGLEHEEKARLYRDMIRRADKFLLRFPTGYFASSMLYQKGFAQFQLQEYEDSISTFSNYLDTYPFAPSIEGAEDFVAKAKAALRVPTDTPRAGGSEAMIRVISSGLGLVDQFSDTVKRREAQPITEHSVHVDVADGQLVVDAGGQREAFSGDDLELTAFDRERHDALTERIGINWKLFNRIDIDRALASSDERHRLELRLDELRKDLCQDLRALVHIYEAILLRPLPDHYTLFDVCPDAPGPG